MRVAIVGSGNIGRAALEAVSAAPDMQIAGVVRRSAEPLEAPWQDVPVATDVDQLGKVDVALLCCPSRSVPDLAPLYLKKGICTVDSFDIHTQIADLRAALRPVAQESGAVSIISAGWDPGSDSVVRALMEAMAPKGISYTNFGPGMSMGHTVAVKAIAGVKHALSMTMPQGAGIHGRMVYIELEQGADFDAVAAAIKRDPYFVHDDTHVIQVDSVAALQDVGHGVLMERKGVSGVTGNQRFSFSMSINNPALTAQVMVGAARAALHQQPGCYTMIEIPVIDLLPGERDAWVGKLV
ncbi:MAG: diaminopimelate dehydrogenase [Christensenellales bacterium]|jgi:diaminopimelate dehydrogenase